MQQKITLASDGTIVPKRMQPHSTGQAASSASISLSRLQKLLVSQEPSICVVRGEGIGDVIMTTPAVNTLKRSFSNAHITYATNTKYLDGALVSVLMHNPDISHIIERQLLKPEDYDLVINLHCPCIGYEVPGNPPVNRIDLFAKHVGLDLIDPVPRYYIQDNEIEKAKELLGPLVNETLVLIQPSASATRRSFSHRKLKEVATGLFNQHGVRSIFVTHSSDSPTDTIWNNTPGGAEFKDLHVREIAAVMSQVDLVLCPDSSILHLAGALRIPTVALFGPTHPAARVDHYENAIAIWKGRDYAPCPCWYQACSIGEICWDAISSNEVLEVCINQLRMFNKQKRSLPFTGGGVIIETETI